MTKIADEVQDPTEVGAIWDIPDSWRWSRMGDISNVVGGGTPDTQNATNFGGNIAWITPADLSGYTEKLVANGSRNLSAEGLDNSGAQLMPPGSVLFSSRAPIGYVAIAANPICTNQGFKSFVLKRGLSPDYVYYYLRHAKPLAIKLASGTTFLEISGKNATRIPIPVAPAEEQSRIADALDELLSDLDAGVASLDQVRAKLKLYRASVLKAAVNGTLTAKWRAQHPNTEPARDLLERILIERRRRWEEGQLAKFKAKKQEPLKNWRSKYQEPVGPDSSSLHRVPQSWCWTTIDQCTSRIQYGTSSKTGEAAQGIPVLRMGNLTADGRLLLDNMKYLPVKHDEFPKLLLAPGDLLFNRTNSAELVGKSALYRGEPTPCSFASYLIRVRFLDGLMPAVAMFALNGGFGRAWVNRVVNQMVGQANVNGTKLAAFTFPLPPLAEQEAIVEAVEDQISIIDHLEADLDSKLSTTQGLRQAILQHAFSGKLVPQDRRDEPASVLLQRIAAEREARTQGIPKVKRPAKRRTKAK